MFNDLIYIDKLPTLDLHGETCDIARVYINDFILDNYKLKNKYIVVIHGKGKGLIRNTLYEELKRNKLVEDYKMYYRNDGCTIVKLIENKL